MKKILLSLLCAICVYLSFAQVPVIAGVCDQTINTGVSTTIQKFYEDSLAYTGWSGGTIRNDMYFNGCGQTVTVKINGSDWEKLRHEGKLDGLRYIVKRDNGINLRKIEGTQPVSISSDSFFDSTTLLYTGN
jgi:hypothetical protein